MNNSSDCSDSNNYSNYCTYQCGKDLLDFTSHRLAKMCRESEDSDEMQTIKQILLDYISGNIQVGFVDGEPVCRDIESD